MKAFLQLSLPTPQTPEANREECIKFQTLVYNWVGPILPDNTAIDPVSTSDELACTVDETHVQLYADTPVLTMYCSLNNCITPTQEQFDGWVRDLQRHNWQPYVKHEPVIIKATDSEMCQCEDCRLARQIRAATENIVEQLGDNIAAKVAKTRHRGDTGPSTN